MITHGSDPLDKQHLGFAIDAGLYFQISGDVARGHHQMNSP